MRKTESTVKTKQSVKQVFKNNYYLLKLCFSASPIYLTFFALDAARGQLSVFFEHTYGIGYVLEAAEFGYPFRDVARFLLILAAAITIGMIFTVIVGEYIGKKEMPKIRRKVKMMLYEKAKELDLQCYDNPEYYNEMVLAISEVDKQIDRAFTLVQSLVSGVTVFICTGIYFFTKDKLSIIFVVISFVMTFVFNQIYNKLSYEIRIHRNPHERKRDYIKRVFYLSDYAKELRLNPEVSDILFEDFEKANDEIYKVEKSYAKRRFWYSFLRRYVSNDFFSDVVYITYMVFKAAVLKTLSFSSVAILYNSFGSLKRSLRIFTDIYPYASETSLYVQKIRDFLSYEPEIVSKKNLPVSEGAKEIRLEHVSFAYSKKAKNVINDVSFSIAPGEKIALVGYNGAGKTTLIKLIMRLYDTTGGVIYADGKDIKDYDVEQYRNSIGTVFQDYKIFAGTVAENVLLDIHTGEHREKIEKALAHSGLSERVKTLSEGLDTPLTTEFNEKGVNLSGGESQKLAIGHVFYKDAGLIILDEPSSALDPIAEYQLNHSMLEATENKTVIFISHRLSTTRLADRIILLENGSIAEQGTHEELLTRGGKYQQMWKAQAGQYISV